MQTEMRLYEKKPYIKDEFFKKRGRKLRLKKLQAIIMKMINAKLSFFPSY